MNLLEARVPRTAKQVCAWAHDAFGVVDTANAMTKLLKRLGLVHNKPKCGAAKADEAARRRFVAETLVPSMRAARADRPLDFVDATHPAHTGRPAHGWMRKGATREPRRNHGRVRVTINGALCRPDRAPVHRHEDKITSAAMIAPFADLAAARPEAARITVVLDDARDNHSKELRDGLARDGCRITPVYLPSDAPNLNMIERVWLFMKRKVLFNTYDPTFADFRKDFDDFLAHIGGWKDEIERLLTPKFHDIGAPENGIP